MDFLLKNGSIEKNEESIPILLNFEMLTKDYIKGNREIIWTLLIEYGYLSMVHTNNKSKHIKLLIKNEMIKKFIKKSFSKYEKHFYEKYNIIDLSIKSYDKEKIKESLENLIIINKYSKNDLLNNWYSLIYSLFSLKNKYVVIFKNNFNENDKIRELLFVKKEFLNNLKSNFNDNKIEKNKNVLSSESSSKVFYITIMEVPEIEKFEKICIQALDDNNDFIFNDIKLKDKYNKIIKFRIAFYENECDMIYEINYGNNFERKIMPKIVFSEEDFEKFNYNDYFFIDKTRMISKIISQKSSVYLITRPRRFGKSLNLKMVQEFFEKPNKENDNKKNIFDGLEVSKDRKNMREFHKYPVIFLNFKEDESNNYESAIEFLKIIISNLFKYQRNKIDFEKLSELEQSEWNKMENQEENELNLKKSIYFLTEILTKFYKRKCIILIDEYDKFLINSCKYNYYEKMQETLKSLFSSTFKGNKNLYIGITTGCLELGLNSLFSGINNFRKCSVYNKK